MRLLRFCFMLLMLLTAVSCIPNTPNTLPTQVPVAVLPERPPGTNALMVPWENATNPDIGLSLNYPQDWSSTITTEAIRLSPITLAQTSAEYRIPVNVSLLNITEADNTGSIVDTLESLMSIPDFGPPETITRLSPPTAVSINDYEAVAAQLIFTPPLLEQPQENQEQISDTFSAPEKIQLYIVVLRHNDRTVLFTGSIPPDYSKDYLPIFESMVQTIQILPPQTE